MDDRRKIFSGVLLLLLGLAGAAVLVTVEQADLSCTVEIPRKQIQQRIAKSFPMSKEAVGLTLELSDPQVKLSEGTDRIGLEATVSVKQPGLKVMGLQLVNPSTFLQGSLILSGYLDYAPTEGVVYFVSPQLRKLTVDGLPEQLLLPVQRLTNELLAAKLSRVPVHRFEGRDLREKVAKLLKLVPQLSLPLTIVGIIDLIIETQVLPPVP